MSHFSRKLFLKTSLLSGASVLVSPLFLNAQQDPPPALDKALVKQFVTEAHRDIDKVKKMLTETPNLINAVHNWGAWDWEDALGAAAHMGHYDMAKFLLEKGARMTICSAAMMGELDIVKSFIQAFPYMKNAVGAHNITLLEHAEAGKEKAVKVVDYLKGLH